MANVITCPNPACGHRLSLPEAPPATRCAARIARLVFEPGTPAVTTSKGAVRHQAPTLPGSDSVSAGST